MGADHKGYVKRMQSAMHALFGDDISLEIKLCNLVKFMENGNAMKMSKRDGTFVSIKDILEKIDKNVLRFLMLSKKENTPFDFDFQKTVENSKDNPVFYLQYAYARIQSVKKQAIEAFKDILKIDPNDIKNEDMRFLNSKDEIKIMRYLSIWPKTLYSAVYTLDPSKSIT